MQRLFSLTKSAIPLWLFVLGYTLLTLLAFQGPLLGYSLPNIDLGGLSGIVELVSLQVIQFLLMVVFLTALAALSTLILKIICALLLVLNTSAAFFMTTFNAEIDITMIANILNTDQREMLHMWQPSLMLNLIFFALVPAVLIFRLNIVKPRWFVNLAASAVTLVLLVAWVLGTAFTWPWFDHHGTRLGARLLPWSYIANTIRYVNQTALLSRTQELMPDAVFAPVPDGQKDIVVLVIGEASRAQNYAYYGYPRDTNPFTRNTGLVALPAGRSCATFTIGSIACMVTYKGSAASSRTRLEPIQSYLTRFGVETIFRTNNFGEPPIDVTRYERITEIIDRCNGPDCPTELHDEALLLGLADELTASTSQRIFVTLHQAGSHGPSYWRKYPAEFNEFKPVCETVDVSTCTTEELVNAYDNTVRYTDYVNARLIEELKSVPDARIAMIYVSDHGQSLGENGLYLHGAPLAIAPETQRLIPFLVWMSDSFQAAHGVTAQSIQRAETKPHDFPFHSIMGAFGMTSPVYRPEYDIFAPK